MKKSQKMLVGGSLIAVLTAVGTGTLLAQSNKSTVKLQIPSQVSIEVKDGIRYIKSNGIPNHEVGQFPGIGNPNKISAQSYSWQMPAKPTESSNSGMRRGTIFGVAVNGVPFDPGTAELWNNNFEWHYEALAGYIPTNRNGLGVDSSLAHVQPNGAYHYHGLPYLLLQKLDYQKKMAVVGYAADGYPIYGNYGYSNAQDMSSGMKKLVSSYRIRKGSRPEGGPPGAYDGSFQQDYEYVAGLGDLDKNNGRFGVTPEYPNGTYYYVLTDTFPFVPRTFKGNPDQSFMKREGPGGGPGGPGGGGFGQGGPGQGGPGGFGQGGPGQGGPGGPGGPGFQGGPPQGMVPIDALADYLGLNEAQKIKLEKFKKVVEALNKENFAPHAMAQLKLTDAQIDRIAKGEAVRKVLTESQIQVLDSNQRRGGPPPME